MRTALENELSRAKDILAISVHEHGSSSEVTAKARDEVRELEDKLADFDAVTEHLERKQIQVEYETGHARRVAVIEEAKKLSIKREAVGADVIASIEKLGSSYKEFMALTRELGQAAAVFSGDLSRTDDRIHANTLFLSSLGVFERIFGALLHRAGIDGILDYQTARLNTGPNGNASFDYHAEIKDVHAGAIVSLMRKLRDYERQAP